MNPGLVLGAIVLVAVLFVLLPVGGAAYSRFRRRWRLRCPAEGVEADVRIDPGEAARAEIFGRSGPTVAHCSLWPERRGCAAECLHSPAHEWRHPGPGERPPRPAGADDRSTILVPLDGTPGSERALNEVVDLARARRARLRLLRVARLMPELRVDSRVIAFADQETARVELETLAYLRQLAEGLGDIETDPAVRFGDPEAEIVKDAEVARADLIAMATRRRHGLAGMLQESVAQKVQRAADVPVLLVPYGAYEPGHTLAGGTGSA
ncbi:MAG TPA: universal stress protein [Methylomirabilota bacterium]|nr:universal stress protein [Methylomirabilota bacterium]